MASSNNLDALSQDGELPFGHPGPNFDDTPEGFEPSPLVDQGPERDCMPDEYRLRGRLSFAIFSTAISDRLTIRASRSEGRAHGRRAATRRRSGRRSPAGSGGSSPSARCPRPGSRQPVPGSRGIRPPGPGRPCRPRSCSRSRKVDVRPGRCICCLCL